MIVWEWLVSAWSYVAKNSGAATIIATVIAGLAGFLLNAAADGRRRVAEREAHLLKGLELLSGGTQKRSAGIGLLEGLLAKAHSAKNNELRSVFVPVIRNQLIYLATTTDSKGEVHEHDNFVRLCKLWCRLKPEEADKLPLADALPLRSRGTLGLEFDAPYDTAFSELCHSVGIPPPPKGGKAKHSHGAD